MVRQKHAFGCGVACVSIATNISYDRICAMLGENQAAQSGFSCKELCQTLSVLGTVYEYHYLKPRLSNRIYKEGVIVFLKRSQKYPAGHYLIRHKNKWHDSWINFSPGADIKGARPGLRARLPYRPSYALFPYNKN